jgi:hypothetical protein
MIKKLIYIAFTLTVIALVSSLTGCKKGDNDPFLSLRSRTARVTGEWKLKEGVVTYESNFGGSLTSETTVYTETTITTNGASDSYIETLTINKDGTYTMSIIEDGDDLTVSGVWFFAGKIKDLDLKNKESIILTPQEYSEPGGAVTINGLHQFNGLHHSDALIIDRLANDELIFKGDYNHDTGAGLNFGSSSTYEKRYEKQ